MGLKNSNLFEFQVGDNKIGYIDPNEAFEDTADAGEVTLDLLLMKEGFTVTYLYDFGDYWPHTVEVEKNLEKENDKVYPVCTEGQLACPPEDSGGIHGYKEVKRWLGRGYDPEKFNIDKVNRELPRFKKYMMQWKLTDI